MRNWAATLSLALLAFGGYIKGAPLIELIPVDITLIGALGVTVSIWRYFSSRTARFAGAAAPLLLYIALLLGAIPSSPLSSYAFEKTIQAAALIPLCIFGGYSVLRSASQKEKWIFVLVVLGLTLSILALLFPDSTQSELGRLSLDGGSTIGVARGTGAAVTLLATLAVFGRRQRLTLGIAVAILAALMFFVGSRGPILAVVASVLTIAILSRVPGRFSRTIATSVVGGILFMVAYLLRDRVNQRLFTLDDTSSSTRIRLWSDAFQTIMENPMGIGWGNFYLHVPPGHTLETGYRLYPHNFILEIALEAGVAAGCIVLVVLITSLHRQVKASTTITETCMLALLVFFVVSALVSGDINSNRGLWVAMGAALSIGARVNYSSRACL